MHKTIHFIKLLQYTHKFLLYISSYYISFTIAISVNSICITIKYERLPSAVYFCFFFEVFIIFLVFLLSCACVLSLKLPSIEWQDIKNGFRIQLRNVEMITNQIQDSSITTIPRKSSGRCLFLTRGFGIDSGVSSPTPETKYEYNQCRRNDAVEETTHYHRYIRREFRKFVRGHFLDS